MVRLYTDTRMLGHAPPARHPECPERLRAVTRHLDRLGLSQACRLGRFDPATDEQLLRVHRPAMVLQIAACDAQGGVLIDADTWDGPGSNLAARLAAGAVAEAVRG